MQETINHIQLFFAGKNHLLCRPVLCKQNIDRNKSKYIFETTAKLTTEQKFFYVSTEPLLLFIWFGDSLRTNQLFVCCRQNVGRNKNKG